MRGEMPQFAYLTAIRLQSSSATILETSNRCSHPSFFLSRKSEFACARGDSTLFWLIKSIIHTVSITKLCYNISTITSVIRRGDEFLRHLFNKLVTRVGFLNVIRENTIDAKTSIRESLVAAWGNFSMSNNQFATAA